MTLRRNSQDLQSSPLENKPRLLKQHLEGRTERIVPKGQGRVRSTSSRGCSKAKCQVESLQLTRKSEMGGGGAHRSLEEESTSKY